MSCSGSLKPGSFGYLGQTALALIGPIYDTLVESTIFSGSSSELMNKLTKKLSVLRVLAEHAHITHTYVFQGIYYKLR